MKYRLLSLAGLLLGMAGLSACSMVRAQDPSSVTADLPDGGSLSVALDEALAVDAVPQTIPALESPEFSALSHPEYTCLELEGYSISEAVSVRWICAIPVADYAALNEQAANDIVSLRALLDERPSLVDQAGTLPDLPVPNAAQVLQAQPLYLDFENGAGIRYLTMHVQDMAPVTNQGLAYSFQGLTDDGAYLISVTLPVTHPALPESLEAVPDEAKAELFMMMPAEYIGTYGVQIQAELDGYAAADFKPSLAALDALVGTIATIAP